MNAPNSNNSQFSTLFASQANLAPEMMNNRFLSDLAAATIIRQAEEAGLISSGTLESVLTQPQQQQLQQTLLSGGAWQSSPPSTSSQQQHQEAQQSQPVNRFSPYGPNVNSSSNFDRRTPSPYAHEFNRSNRVRWRSSGNMPALQRYGGASLVYNSPASPMRGIMPLMGEPKSMPRPEGNQSVARSGHRVPWNSDQFQKPIMIRPYHNQSPTIAASPPQEVPASPTISTSQQSPISSPRLPIPLPKLEPKIQPLMPNLERKTASNRKQKRKGIGETAQRSLPWSRDDAVKALALEQELFGAHNVSDLILKFPDPEVNKRIVMGYDSVIKNVYFKQPALSRYCFVTLTNGANVQETIDRINKIPFGNGFILAERKFDPEEERLPDKPEDIDPYTLYIGNLSNGITSAAVKDLFPTAMRIDIGFAQRMKYTRYAFVRYGNVEEAMEAYRRSFNTVLEARNIIVRFRRNRGNVGLIGANEKRPLPNQRPNSASNVSNASDELASTSDANISGASSARDEQSESSASVPSTPAIRVASCMPEKEVQSTSGVAATVAVERTRSSVACGSVSFVDDQSNRPPTEPSANQLEMDSKELVIERARRIVEEMQNCARESDSFLAEQHCDNDNTPMLPVPVPLEVKEERLNDGDGVEVKQEVLDHEAVAKEKRQIVEHHFDEEEDEEEEEDDPDDDPEDDDEDEEEFDEDEDDDDENENDENGGPSVKKFCLDFKRLEELSRIENKPSLSDISVATELPIASPENDCNNSDLDSLFNDMNPDDIDF